MPAPDATFRFGPYELRPQSRELFKSGRRLKLRPQPFQVLHALLERSGHVVTREELRQILWPVETFVDFEHSLNTSIKELRGVLNDSAGEPRYIETLPKLGYRIVVPVASDLPIGSTEAVPRPEASDAQASPPENGFLDRLRHLLAPRPRAIAIAASVVLLLGLAAYLQWLRPRPRPEAPSARFMLAVLPFENLTGDAAQDYFSDGMTEEMITHLGRLDPQRLGVIARTSVMHYKHGQEQLEEIGRELGVQYVLEGSVRRDADKVRISAQLIQTKDQTHLWARQYDREMSSLLTLQAEIAQEIADEIQLTFDGNRPVAPVHHVALSPQAYEAYDLYLKGRYFWNKRTPQDLRRAIDCFQQAIAKDPAYARAYAGLADSYALMSGYNLAPPTENMPKARAAALRALQMDDHLAEAHASLASIAQNYDWDWETAEREYRRAIQLDPNYATAHHWYAQCLGFLGRFDEAFSEMERARQLDPLSLIIATDHGEVFYLSRQYDRAVQQFHAVLGIDPGFPRAHFFLEFAYAQMGSFADALADVETWRGTDDTPWSLTMTSYVSGRSGQPAQARRALDKLLLWNRRRPIDSGSILCAYIALGDKDQTFAWLEKSYSEHSTALTSLKVNPIYDPLRGDPRFQALLRRVGLSP
jgi:TolB-like protein/DNA-binding winged helix-turn-helix (wHTH) protein